MIITEQYLTETFARLNKQLFAGRLPQVTLRITTAKTFLGNCRSNVTHDSAGQRHHTEFILQVSRNFDLTPLELDSVIAHEMIHLFIMLHELPDTGPHGEIFRAMMNGFNRRYGLRIEVRSDVPPEKKLEPKPRYRVVARIKLADGKTGIKVLPRVAQTIRAYKAGVMRSNQVKSIEFFMSCNPLFARYPSSGALRVYHIDPAILNQALADAEPLRQL